jgi:conserved domain protein
MSANSEAYSKLFGDICDSAVTMARCACVACNSCTCACSCRNIPEWEDTEIDW